MGLDMYFEATRTMSSSYLAGDDDKDTTAYPDDLKVLADYIVKRNFKSVLKEEHYQIGYFRKFNALHNYIVQTYADGEDNCRRIYLWKDDIVKLRDICKSVLENHSQASGLLPTADGFFFGSTDYDEYYFEKVKEAVNFFNMVIKNIDFKKWKITYSASW